MKKIRIGSGAGYAGDRLEPSLELIEKGDLDYIAYECLAERTIAIAQQAKLKDPTKGYNGLLEYRMNEALPLAHKHHVKIITNMGAANPQAALEVVAKIAQEKGIKGIKIAAVYGDDVFPKLDKYKDVTVWETGKPLKELDGEIVSANAYLGAEGIVEALRQGADVVITGRVSDPAIFMAPLIYEFGWKMDDWDKLGKGTVIGHLLECGGQSSGGYYGDPGKKEVPEPWRLGFPLIEACENGDAFITKVPGSGGLVTEDTCKEQLCYEIHDPTSYITPDCVADFSRVRFEQAGKDVVKIFGATGKPRTDSFKVSLGYKDCFIGEGEISYGGPNCVARAMVARETVDKRLKLRKVKIDELRMDIVGVDSLYRNSASPLATQPCEVRLHVAARTKTQAEAAKIGNEVETLYTNGPAGGGGANARVSEIISVASILIPRSDSRPVVVVKEVK